MRQRCGRSVSVCLMTRLPRQRSLRRARDSRRHGWVLRQTRVERNQRWSSVISGMHMSGREEQDVQAKSSAGEWYLWLVIWSMECWRGELGMFL